MKKTTKLFIAIVLGIALNVSTASAKQYCHEPVTSGASTIYLSCENPSEGTYLLTIQSDVAMSKLSDGVYCHTSNGDFQIGKTSNHTVSADKKTITSTILSTTPPVPYTPLYILDPAQVIFTWPTDIDWTGTCGSTVPDSEIPTAFTAQKGAVSATSVELLLNATDNSGSIKYTVSYGSTPTVVTATGTSATQKSFIVSNLSPGTEYTFSILAKDAAGNAAVNNPLTITATTTSMLAAPTPTAIEANVISLFSNAYTNNVPVSSWKTAWSAAGALTDMQIAGNDTKKYDGVTFVGIETTGTVVDASSMLYFNVDILTDNITSLKMKLVDFGANGIYNGVGQVDDVEDELTFTPSLTGWNSYHIALTDFAKLTTKAHMAQYIFTAAPAGTSSFYLDNMYFSKENTSSVLHVSGDNGVTCYPNPATDKLIINAVSEISQVIVRNLLGQTLKSMNVNGLTRTIDLNDMAAGNYFVSVKLTSGLISTYKFVKL